MSNLLETFEKQQIETAYYGVGKFFRNKTSYYKKEPDVKKFNEIGINNLLLDLKLKDVGTTVYKAIKALDGINFGFLTIHGQGGKAMIDEAKKAASEIKCKPKIMAVTILTSFAPKEAT